MQRFEQRQTVKVPYLLLVLLFAGRSLAPAANPESGPESPGTRKPISRELTERLRAAGIAPGEGTGRIQVVPSKVFHPRNQPDSPLKTQEEVAVEIDRLRGAGNEEAGTRARAPSDALKGLLREYQMRAALEPPPAVGAGQAGAPSGPPGGNSGNAKGGRESYALYAVANRGRKSAGKGASEVPMVVFDQSPDFDFAAVRGAGVPFHVFDVDPQETILVELSGDEVARVRKLNKDWAWIQLDSGLMGLVRNHHVEPAGEFEILKYLAMEYGKMREEGLVPEDGSGQVRVNLVNGSYQVTGAIGREAPVAAEMAKPAEPAAGGQVRLPPKK